ncbi:MAG: radical SAM protein [Candidatus Viridilinea halotolerans]|uniref:Radical SAM protein n=1 Tax=Candidatus Viridilinea halotolerans TaxID=2491704 RepID=A0A426U1T6_9CHLR|nr:MAG: radical SAM protein [Candidatus Viridilinea halotolerans]
MVQILVPQLPPAALNDCRLARPLSAHSTLVSSPILPLEWLRPHPLLRTLPLDDEHVVAFVPSLSHVAVLNQAALALLERLPLSAAEELGSAAGALHAMAARGLLVAATQPSPPAPPPSPVLSAWLHVTNACNLRCSYCYINKTTARMTPEMACAAVDTIVDTALRYGYREVALKYAGGEPLMALTTVAAAHTHAQTRCAAAGLTLQATLLTNGTMLSPARAAQLRELDLGLTVSLDGLTLSHDAQRPDRRGAGSADTVRAGIANAHAAGLAPTVAITVTGASIGAVPELVAWLLEQELPFTVSFARNQECSRERSAMLAEEQQIIVGMRAIYATVAANPPRWSLLGTLLDRADLSYAHGGACAAGKDYMVIDHEGHIAACQMVLDQPVADLTHPDPLGAIRADRNLPLGVPVDEKAGCRDCAWRYWCGGGCPIATLRATGRTDVKSPYCNIYTALFPDLLRLEGLRLLTRGE